MSDKASWFGAQPIGPGQQACAAINKNGLAVVVYVKPNSTTLCSRVGVLDRYQAGMVWFAEQVFDSGQNPSVSINDDGAVVSVHETDNSVTRRIFYRVGIVKDFAIEWGNKNSNYDTGYKPSVSLNSRGDVAEVHQSANIFSSWELKCWYGKLDLNKKTVSWSSNEKYSDGSSPCVSLNNAGEVLEVEKTRGDGWGLWYRRGTVDATKKKLNWNKANPSMGEGFVPRVALTDYGTAVEINQTFTIINTGYTVTRFGTYADGGLMSWESDQLLYTGGGGMSVGVVGDDLALVVGEIEPRMLSSQVGALYTNWMETFQRRLQKLTLRSVILPGSHDSGTCEINADSDLSPDAEPALHAVPKSFIVGFARAQGLSIENQLKSGIRYLDLRVAPDKDQALRLVHSMYGGYVNQAIEAVARFLKEHTREIVVLDFQHFYSMTESDHAALLNKLYAELEPLLLAPVNPSHVTLEQLWKENKRVIVLYSYGDVQFFKDNKLLWSRASYIDSPWADTDKLEELHVFLDEKTQSAGKDRFFVMQGVLTPHIGSYITLSTLEYLARTYNHTIMGWAKDWQNRPLNILMADWVGFGGVVATAVQMNLSRVSAMDELA